MTRISLQEQEELIHVLSLYDLKNPQSLSKSLVGSVNHTFFIEYGDKKYALRRSSPETSKEHLDLEVSLLKYLQSQNFHLTPELFPNIYGEFLTFHNGSYFTLQNFLSGESKGSWNDLSRVNNEMLKSLFRAAANLDKTLQNFTYPQRTSDFTVLEYAVHAEKLLQKFYNALPASKGKKMVADVKEDIINSMEKTAKEMNEMEYNSLPKQVVHFDFHFGNANFIGNEVSGIFDFDWARFDTCIANIASTIAATCYQYGGENTGIYFKEKIQTALNAYREVFRASNLDIQKENQLIGMSVKSFMFFQLLFTMNLYKNDLSEENEEAIKTMIQCVLKNNYNSLFSFE